MRISDWSSDVCSSDLAGLPMTAMVRVRRQQRHHAAGLGEHHLFERGIDLAPARRLLERRGRARAVAHVGDGDLHGIFVHLDVVMSEDFGANHGILRSEEHTSELQSLMRISYAVCCWNKK